MFNVKNTKIQGDKTLSIGMEREITIDFLFEDVQLLDTDDFILVIGDTYSFNYAFKNDGFLSFRKVDLSQIIAQSSENFTIKIYQNDDVILDDVLTINAEIGDIVLTNYYTKTETDALFNNELKIRKITDTTDSITLAYDPSIDIVQVNNTTETASLTINPCTGYTAVTGKVPTFEFWIKPTTKKTTLTISNSIQIVGEFPAEFTANTVHCFTFRFVGSNQLLNYSHSFTEE